MRCRLVLIAPVSSNLYCGLLLNVARSPGGFVFCGMMGLFHLGSLVCVYGLVSLSGFRLSLVPLALCEGYGDYRKVTARRSLHYVCPGSWFRPVYFAGGFALHLL